MSDIVSQVYLRPADHLLACSPSSVLGSVDTSEEFDDLVVDPVDVRDQVL
ncbi:MAG: hypothetical protein WBZ37_06765 [Mycobacterium sp.]